MLQMGTEFSSSAMGSSSFSNKHVITILSGVMKALANELVKRKASHDFIQIPNQRRNCCIDYYKINEDRSVRIEYINEHDHIPEKLITG